MQQHASKLRKLAAAAVEAAEKACLDHISSDGAAVVTDTALQNKVARAAYAAAAVDGLTAQVYSAAKVLARTIFASICPVPVV